MARTTPSVQHGIGSALLLLLVSGGSAGLGAQPLHEGLFRTGFDRSIEPRAPATGPAPALMDPRIPLLWEAAVPAGVGPIVPPPPPDGDPGSEPPPESGGLAAFPGAQGWGSRTPGGRGGRVIYVTARSDSGPGSLREALTTPGPRIVLFRVSGIIHLRSPIVVAGEELSYLTVAGQSAPGGGVIVADFGIELRGGAHDVVLRFLRFRDARRILESGSAGDGIELQDATHVVIDHCSFSWATDENVSMERGTNTDVTVQYSMIAEGLSNGGHELGKHSMGLNLSRGADRVSLHHNLFASNNMRNPHLAGNNAPDRLQYGPPHPTFDVRYNLVYNWGKKGAHLEHGAYVNLVGNLLVPGPGTRSPTPIEIQDVSGIQLYLAGNGSGPAPAPEQAALVLDAAGPGNWRALAPFPAPAVAATPLDLLAAHVLGNAGALPLDATDLRLVQEFWSGTGAVGAPERNHGDGMPSPATGDPYLDSDGDGIEDAWERVHGLDPANPADGPADFDGDGYTNLEEFLESLIPAG